MEHKNLKDGDLQGKVTFAVGTGRCGTRFLYEVMSKEPEVASCHERNVANETFHRYCKWYALPVDHGGFLAAKAGEIRQDLAIHAFSFEASALLSFSIIELFGRFRAKFILMVRRPEDVINSYIRKGWYAKEVIVDNPAFAIGYQPNHEYIFRGFGRTIPQGDEYIRWSKLTSVGKLAWFWNTANARIIGQFNKIPQDYWRVIRLEDLNYEVYQEKIVAFMGFQSNMTQVIYEKLAHHRPNKLSNVPTIKTWDTKAIEEFEQEVAPMTKFFGYPGKYAELPCPKEMYRNPEQNSFVRTIARYLKRHWKNMRSGL